MFDVFSVVNRWDAEALEPTNHKSLFTRTIGGQAFQFKKLDVRSRSKMLMSLRSIVSVFEPVIIAGVRLKQAGTITDASGENEVAVDTDDKDIADLLQDFLPQLFERVFDDDLAEMIESLCEKAYLHNGTAKYEQLTNPAVYESAFDADLSLQIPVALTVLEVNLADSFFKILQGLLSAVSPTED